VYVLKILIADDAVFMRTILSGIIERSFHDAEVTTYNDGVDLVAGFKAFCEQGDIPSLALIDITMPKLDGLSALKQMQKINDKVPMIICSSLSSQHTVIEAIRSGACDFISKPFAEESIVEKVEKYLYKVVYDKNGRVENLFPAVFFYYIRQGNIKVVRDFLESGMNINARINGKSAADACIQSNSSDMLLYLHDFMDLFDLNNRTKIKNHRLTALTSDRLSI
jgi:two-component system chemotaxis response regulator CheY